MEITREFMEKLVEKIRETLLYTDTCTLLCSDDLEYCKVHCLDGSIEIRIVENEE